MEVSFDNFTDQYSEDLHLSHVYSSENIPGRGCNLEEVETQICNSCSCSPGDCSDGNSCACVVLSHGMNYMLSDQSSRVKIISEAKLTSVLNNSHCIFECNDMCSCSVTTCMNRLVQFGPRKALTVKTNVTKGYCLFTNLPIRKGEFICEYAGEIISNDEAKRRFESDSESNRMNYIFILHEIFTDHIAETIIDPSYIGNIGRYINHSCNPNAIIIPVRVNSVIPKLAIFAKSDIEANKEITMSYSTAAASALHPATLEHKLCHCLEDNCAKYLPFDAIV